MARFLLFLLNTAKKCFLAFCVLLTLLTVFIVLLTFRQQKLPQGTLEHIFSRYAPSNIVLRCGSASLSILSGLHIEELSIIDISKPLGAEPIASADHIEINPLGRHVKITGAKYPRLPDSYYAPVNNEKNEHVNVVLPELPKLRIDLERPEILSLAPERAAADIRITTDGIFAERFHLEWPDDEEKMFLDGACSVNFTDQKVSGRVYGSAMQKHIRPFLVSLDIPSALPYFDNFTEVKGKIPSACDWVVNLTNNDLDLHLDLHPRLGRYNLVPMEKADGELFLHVYTRDGWLNYRHVFGPIIGTGPNGEPLEGTVKVSGTNGFNTVEVVAKSTLPVADLLRIGGFTDSYVNTNIFGESSCSLVFKFPRSMTNNYELLNGSGTIKILNGQIMRLKGFEGLLEKLAEKVPGVSWFTDSTQASCDYVIENGVFKSQNISIEGSVFSIRMNGIFDIPKEKLDFTVRVEFTKRNSFMGKILNPLAWPFTKLLLEFRLGGTPQNPKWNYISVIDRVVEAAK